uniref:hypothetical protein n=1 Tax=Candidatus Fimivicinus sp. TaxID=3056640 RepID=UPI003FEEA246
MNNVHTFFPLCPIDALVSAASNVILFFRYKKRERIVVSTTEGEGRKKILPRRAYAERGIYASEADEGRHSACGREGDVLLFDSVELLNGWDVGAFHGIKYIIYRCQDFQQPHTIAAPGK